MHEIRRRVLVGLPTVLGVDLSITNEVVLLWLAAAVTFIVLTLALRRRDSVPHGVFQNVFDGLLEFVEEEVVRGCIGKEGRAWAPFLLTLFFFILFANLLGMVPLPDHFKAVTSNLSVTAALALIVFMSTIMISIRRHGVIGFLKKFVPSGLPKWVIVMVAPIEVISWLAKPVSLSIRLFANIMVGHALILVFVGLALAANWFIKPLPLAGAVVMSAFELFVSFIQAFIFAMLAGIYIREAIEAH